MYPSKIKVLILDDDVNFLEATEMLLKEAGFDVAICEKSTECHTAIRTFKPQCLLLDLRMPLLNGDTLLPWLRLQFPYLAVIACTGVSNYNRSYLNQLGVRYIIEKPFQYDLLITTIERVVDEEAPPFRKSA